MIESNMSCIAYVRGFFLENWIHFSFFPPPKSVNFTANKDNKLWNLIQQLQSGISWHWTKPFLMFETRFVQPTCLGLPVEISKYYSTLAAVTLNGNNYSHSSHVSTRQHPTKTHITMFFCFFLIISAKANIDPPPKESLPELINADISVETDGFAGYF